MSTQWKIWTHDEPEAGTPPDYEVRARRPDWALETLWEENWDLHEGATVVDAWIQGDGPVVHYEVRAEPSVAYTATEVSGGDDDA